ncbi:MAG TPA: GNAT family N-acetyltransferase, partial [Candidatus Saccharimonadales bacterium]|nr:GNAT family N-acetyltransferase [Candidatus Saccharimonadales bacterium]
MDTTRIVAEIGDARIVRSGAPIPSPAGPAFTWLLEGAFGTDEKPDIFVGSAARGLYEDVARCDFAWAEVGGQIVSTALTLAPRDEPRIGTMGEVFTAPEHRGRGLARAVCGALLDTFDERGGLWMFLATSNPTAARAYRSLGFEPHPDGLMLRERPPVGGFEADWFAPSEVSFRPITLGDSPRIVALYATPSPWLSICWMQGFYSAARVTHNRCNSLIKQTWQSTRSGAWLGMFNSQGALVGSAPIEPHGNDREPIAGDVDLFVHPGFRSRAAAFLDTAVAAGVDRGYRWLTVELGTDDQEKR